MSLINDALRRAKDAQPNKLPPPPGPRLRRAEPGLRINAGMGAIPVGIIVLIVIMTLFLLWQSQKKIPENKPVAETKPASPVIPAPETKRPVKMIVASTPKPAMIAPVVEKAAPPVVVASAVAGLKLQAIFFVPGRSSAIISGKTVRAGDTVWGFRVAAIARSSATLVSATETNVMTLAQ